ADPGGRPGPPPAPRGGGDVEADAGAAGAPDRRELRVLGSISLARMGFDQANRAVPRGRKVPSRLRSPKAAKALELYRVPDSHARNCRDVDTRGSRGRRRAADSSAALRLSSARPRRAAGPVGAQCE